MWAISNQTNIIKKDELKSNLVQENSQNLLQTGIGQAK